jgi:acyl-CoA reductase-like NAD-dependent aldehyde dehydrogenase
MSRTFTSFNPADANAVVARFRATTAGELDQWVTACRVAAQVWSGLELCQRVEQLAQLPAALVAARDRLARTLSMEMGKAFFEALEEIDDAVEECTYLLNRAPSVLGEQPLPRTADGEHVAVWQGLGTVAVITPWNYPVEIALWGIVGALLAGNAVLYKPSEVTPLTGQLLYELLLLLDLPPGLVGLVQGDGREGQMLVESGVDAVWFVGSEQAGQDIYCRAAKTMKKCLLELGGSSPTLLFADFEVSDELIDLLLASRFTNAGQVCSAMKRLYIEQPIFDAVVRRLSQRLQKIRVAEPFAIDCGMGPLASSSAFDRLQEQVTQALASGATSPQIEAWRSTVSPFFPPMLLLDVTPTMSVMLEEVFGPVLPVIPFFGEEEAIRLANASRYGLSASIFCADAAKAGRVAARIDAGRVLVNARKSAGIAYPVEGFKCSGLGRHQGDWLLLEMARMKYIKFGHGPGPVNNYRS